MATTHKTIDDIARTKTSVDGTERIPARDSSGDFKITVANFQASLTAPSTYFTTANYTVLDNDNYERIEVDTTSGDITITLPLKANNLKRRIEIAHVKGGTYKVIIAPNATDGNTLSGDALSAIWLPKVGDIVAFQESANSGYWEITNERITAQLRLNTYAGYGSSDTKIPRFTNSVENTGNMFTENHSTGYNSNAEGLKITAQKSGKYFIGCYGVMASTGGQIGVSLNAASLSTSLLSLTASQIVTGSAQASLSSSNHFGTSATIFLNKNDILRIHSDGFAPVSNYAYFICTYIGQ